jgi:tetratricopeptide (TPR) repeat protein
MDLGRGTGYRESMIRRTLATIWLVSLVCMRAAAGDAFEDALTRAQKAADDHRYQLVIEILTPFNSDEDPERRYITAAEIGRAYFHLGQYQLADRAFRQAVRLHPERVETAVYLEATSYLLGNRGQSLLILNELLESGARDLYLAVTLPGERKFLADPEVQSVIARHAVPLEINPELGTINGVALGTPKSDVIVSFSASSSDPGAPTLSASAGPAVIWAFTFDHNERLNGVLLNAENLYRYTPYRLHFGDQLDWRATPAAAAAVLGPPENLESTDAGDLVARWDRPTHGLTLYFATPRAPRPEGVPPGAAMLRAVQLDRRSPRPTDRMAE